ncbi:hypothetical protein [Nocardia exalbida]|uniref:hypothetical protein n=1 Tax=Nocardia exalbida TaxID=290231 RepID=UPI0012F68345|nr:hypothetical protein [Nocardia exalbida]
MSAPRWPGEPDTVAATRADPSGWRGLGLAALTAQDQRPAAPGGHEREKLRLLVVAAHHRRGI